MGPFPGSWRYRSSTPRIRGMSRLCFREPALLKGTEVWYFCATLPPVFVNRNITCWHPARRPTRGHWTFRPDLPDSLPTLPFLWYLRLPRERGGQCPQLEPNLARWKTTKPKKKKCGSILRPFHWRRNGVGDTPFEAANKQVK